MIQRTHEANPLRAGNPLEVNGFLQVQTSVKGNDRQLHEERELIKSDGMIGRTASVDIHLHPFNLPRQLGALTAYVNTAIHGLYAFYKDDPNPLSGWGYIELEVKFRVEHYPSEGNYLEVPVYYLLDDSSHRLLGNNAQPLVELDESRIPPASIFVDSTMIDPHKNRWDNEFIGKVSVDLSVWIEESANFEIWGKFLHLNNNRFGIHVTDHWTTFCPEID